MRLVIVCGTAVPANWKLEIIFSLDKCLRSHESAVASFVREVMRKCLFCWAAPAPAQLQRQGLVWSVLTGGLRSHFINQSPALLTVHCCPVCGLLVTHFLCLSQLNCHYREYTGPGRSGSFLPVCDNHVSHSVSPRLTKTHLGPKSHKSRLAGVCSRGLFPRHTAQQDLEIAQHFLMADPSFSSNPSPAKHS